MKKCIYSGTFDPPTNGHKWVIEKAKSLFDELYLVIAYNPAKSHSTFSIEDRKYMLNTIIKDFDNVYIEVLDNKFLVDYAKSIDVNFLIRGIRTIADFEFEKNMCYLNADFADDITTIFLLPPRKYTEISSSMIKSLIGIEGWEKKIKNYLPTSIHDFIINHYNLNK